MKLIYQPKGRAHEYCHWACNLYNGCSNKCEYCYNRHSPAQGLLGKDEPTLKSGFDESAEELSEFVKEFDKVKDKIMKDGGELFFNFVSDPFLEETWLLNAACMMYVLSTSKVVVRTLTKCSKRLVEASLHFLAIDMDRWKIGFTLTGRDDLEPGADSNQNRIEAMEALCGVGFQTWASIEPVIEPIKSIEMMRKAYDAGCREFKIGLLSGKKNYTKDDIKDMKDTIDKTFHDCDILWKDSVLNFINE